MALDAVQLIMQGLRDASARKFAERESQQRQQQIDAQNKDREAQIKLEQDQLKERQRQFDIATKAAKAINDLKVASEMQDIGLKTAKTGIAPAGVQMSPAASSFPNGELNYTPVNQNQATSNILTFPGGEQLTVPTPKTFATQQAEQARILQRPEVEADIEKSRALQADLLKKQAEAKEADFIRIMEAKMFDAERENKRIEAENWRAQLAANTTLAAARIRKTDEDANIDYGKYIEDIADGNLSLEDVGKLPFSRTVKTKIIDGAKNEGLGILKNDQIELVKEFPQIIRTISYMDDLIEGQPDTTNKVTGMFGGLTQTLNPSDTASTNAAKELKARSSVIARFLREKGNLSNRDIERVQAMIPSVFNPKSTNIQLRDSFRNELENLIDSRLANLSPQQRNAIKKRVGIFDIGMYQKKQPEAAQVPLSPQAQELMRRFNIQ